MRYLRFIGVLTSLASALSTVPVTADVPGLAPGHRFEVRAEDLPPPFATPSSQNPSRAIPLPEGTTLLAPPGFVVNTFAEGLRHARWMSVAPDGAVFLAQPERGVVTVLRDGDGDGVAESAKPFAQGFDRPHGLAVQDGFLYVADTTGVRRFAYRQGDDAASAPGELVTSPGALGTIIGSHWTRNLVFSPDGGRFFVTVGSRGNVDEEPSPHATVQMFNRDGSGQRTYGAGLRNPIGIAFYPRTSDLYVVVAERDGLGDGLVPDYLTRVRDGMFFGWPYAYAGTNPQPGFAERRPDLVRRSQPPDVLFQSHSTPIGLVFYDHEQFPTEYRGDALVALRGSFNAAEPRGYMVVRVPFDGGRPRGDYEAFVTGFWVSGTEQAEVVGRPAGLAVAADGSLLIADDVGDRIWRVSYVGE